MEKAHKRDQATLKKQKKQRSKKRLMIKPSLKKKPQQAEQKTKVKALMAVAKKTCLVRVAKRTSTTVVKRERTLLIRPRCQLTQRKEVKMGKTKKRVKTWV